MNYNDYKSIYNKMLWSTFDNDTNYESLDLLIEIAKIVDDIDSV